MQISEEIIRSSHPGLEARIEHIVTRAGIECWVATIYKWSGPITELRHRTNYAIKSFGKYDRARGWADKNLASPTMMLLRFNGRVLYDLV